MDKKEREVSLYELLWNVVFSWRGILLCAVIFAILAGAVRYAGDWKTYQTLQKSSSAEEPETDEFTEEELVEIEDAKAIQEAMDENRDYLENSILMNVDPYAENVLVLQYYVDSDYQFNYTSDNSGDYTSSVVTAYGDYVKSGKVAEKIVDTLGLDCEPRYMEELISSVWSYQDEIFSIEVIYPDENTLNEMIEVITDEMEGQVDRINQTIGSHTLKLLSSDIMLKTDSELASRQKAIQDIITSYRTQLTSLKASMTEDQLAQLTNEKVSDEENEEKPVVTAVRPSVSVKYIVLGVLAGIFLGVVWVVCKVLFTNRLQFADDLTNLYGLRSFGSYRTEKKRFVVDAFLWKLKTRKEKKLTQEEYLDIICSNLELICKSANISRLYLCGTVMEQIGAKLPESIADKMKGAGIDVLCGNDVRYDMRSLRDMKAVGNTVLLEQVGVSGYQEIEKELKAIKEQQVEILGCICVE